ncbi:HAMP domain-containing sensor histidine kinase [Ekhidna sp.]|uniref:sensor histidine kinase n=1 Tax=Ekhidna sp. TaxID=2608089 RepID=UPI003298BB08
MTSVYHFFRGALNHTYDDWPKRRVLVNCLVLSLLFLFITSISFFAIGFTVGGWMGLFGTLGVLHVGILFRRRKKLISAINLLALYANLMFLVEVIYSGGISSPALYWLMCSPFFALIFSDYEVNRNSAFWILLTFTEFVTLFAFDNHINNIPIQYDMAWHETLVLVFAITFMCYCSVIILFDVQSRKYQAFLRELPSTPLIENIPSDNASLEDNMSLKKESGKLHRKLVWIAIVLLPIFPDALFFEDDSWMVLFAIRIGIVMYFVLAQYAYVLGKVSPRFLAHSCLIALVLFLSYATSQVPISNVLVYNLNYSAVFLISALFLLWRWYDTLIAVGVALVSYILFALVEGRLSLEYFVEKGGLLLFSIGFASIWLTDFRHRFYLKEQRFKRRLQESNTTLSNQNEELKKLNTRLKSSEKKQKEASLIKDKFFSIISHDLRSPIGTVSSFIKILNDNTIELGKDKESEILDRLEESLQNVEMLIDNLLNWARSQMGTLKLRPEFFDIREIANQCTRLFSEDLRRKEIEVILEQKVSTRVFGDKQTIEFVIRNLLANAIKFSYEKSRIKIEFEREDKFLNVKVVDFGVGMNHTEINNLMNPNVHFTKPGTAKEMGTGLGVQLCVDFVKKNNGELVIESKPGRGSKFIFCLPINRNSKPSVNLGKTVFNIIDN